MSLGTQRSWAMEPFSSVTRTAARPRRARAILYRCLSPDHGRPVDR
jgi:hypothetical protein